MESRKNGMGLEEINQSPKLEGVLQEATIRNNLDEIESSIEGIGKKVIHIQDVLFIASDCVNGDDACEEKPNYSVLERLGNSLNDLKWVQNKLDDIARVL